jgi:hypothetical protein
MFLNTIDTTQSPFPSSISVSILLVFLSMLIFSGCGDPNMAYVSGKVLIDGQPAPEGLIVQFQPLDKNGSPSSSFTDKNGNYELWFSKTVKGAQIGNNKITVRQQQSDDTLQQKILPFLASFNKNTPLTYEVKGGRQTYDIVIDTSKIPVEKNTGKRKR